jgi:hypothetical protein
MRYLAARGHDQPTVCNILMPSGESPKVGLVFDDVHYDGRAAPISRTELSRARAVGCMP